MKEIQLTRGQIALVDDEDFEYLNQFSWHANKGKTNKTYYAYRTINFTKNNKKYSHSIPMHREIMHPDIGLHIDHIDHNGLNNCRSNLRICTPSQNGMNRQCNKNKDTLKGVTKIRRGGIWRGKYQVSVRSKYVGIYDNEIEAAKIYDIEAKRIFGEFAKLNFG